MGFYLTEQLPGNSLENSDNPHTLYRGLQLSGLRYYNPELGRWVNRDPLGEQEVALNLYCFVGSSPVSRVDVDGRSWWPDKLKPLFEKPVGGGDETWSPWWRAKPEVDLFFGWFDGLGGQAQVTLNGSCCDDDNVKHEYTTIEACVGVGYGKWGGGVGAGVSGPEETSASSLCPPAGTRFYKKLIGAMTLNFYPDPGGMLFGEYGDDGGASGVGFGLGTGGAVVGCVAITTSKEVGCCDE